MTRVNIVCVVSILISRASCLRRKFNRLLKSELRGRFIEALRWTPDSGLADYLTEPYVGLAPIPFNYDLGILVDRALNERDGRDAREIGNSRIPVWVVPAEQELMIARDTLRCILNIPHE